MKLKYYKNIKGSQEQTIVNLIFLIIPDGSRKGIKNLLSISYLIYRNLRKKLFELYMLCKDVRSNLLD